MTAIRRFVPVLFLFGLLATACPANQPTRTQSTPTEEASPDPGEDGDSSPIEGTVFELTLSGAAERPGPGDPDGTGKAKLTVDEPNTRVCYELEASGIGKPDAAHIHEGAVGAAGPNLVTLLAPEGSAEPFKSKGCAGADKALAARIISQPENFYVNIHNAEYKNGAIRGQLTTAAPASTSSPTTSTGSGY